MELASPIEAFGSTDDVFGIAGTPVRTHSGRSVVKFCRNARTYYLKRYWFAPSQLFKRHVARGFHELQVIDWLNDNGFAGPRIVARGQSRFLSVSTRLYFVMEEAPDEVPLEQAWWRFSQKGDSLLDTLSSFAARLHDAGFIHTDFSERHILVGRVQAGWTFRLIDLERARVAVRDDRLAAADLKTLAASVADENLRRRIEADFLYDYIGKRETISRGTDMQALFAEASPTRSF